MLNFFNPQIIVYQKVGIKVRNVEQGFEVSDDRELHPPKGRVTISGIGAETECQQEDVKTSPWAFWT